MAQYSLRDSRGAVILEFLLVLPLLILILSAALLANRTLRGAWLSQAAARNTLWVAQSTGVTPEVADVRGSLEAMDLLLETVDLVPETTGGILETVSAGVRDAVGTLGGTFGVQLPDAPPSPTRIRAVAHLGAGTPVTPRSFYLETTTWSARDLRLSSDDYGRTAHSRSAEAGNRILETGRNVAP